MALRALTCPGSRSRNKGLAAVVNYSRLQVRAGLGLTPLLVVCMWYKGLRSPVNEAVLNTDGEQECLFVQKTKFAVFGLPNSQFLPYFARR